MSAATKAKEAPLMELDASDQDMLFSPIESQADLGCADKVSLVARRLYLPSGFRRIADCRIG